MKKIFQNKSFIGLDGFFPFPDIVKLCSKNNISGIIQPGGSINDKLVIEEAEKVTYLWPLLGQGILNTNFSKRNQ